uniref:Reverse transcriptase zinc-binding domain-containing protein n=1 Tax=Lactuca sativa TaxID=4236 RepID=A0A9R1VRU6_LACSA|nr:hypothetical protein LSAT_V11C400176830 [Lactuca sativa]
MGCIVADRTFVIGNSWNWIYCYKDHGLASQIACYWTIFYPLTLSINLCKEILIKVLCFIWRYVQGRIPSAVALGRRGIHVSYHICGSCIGRLECTNHILVDFLYASLTCDKLFSWCGLQQTSTIINIVGGLLQFAASWGRCPTNGKG